MELEKATKEELIWWIKQNQFSFRYELRNFSHDILFHRSEVWRQKADEAGCKYMKDSEKYTALLKPYHGKHLSEIPDKVIHQAAELEREMLSASKAQRRAWKESDRYMRMVISDYDVQEE